MESKSARMRELLAEGKSVAEVSRLVGVSYQFTYGVAKRAGFAGVGQSVHRAQTTSTRAVPGGVDADANLRTYLADRRSTDRYASFDYCYNYFQSRRDERRYAELLRGPELELACLQLGFYLASWGMYRGSTVLLRRSVAYLAPVIDVIAEAPPEAWAIDVDGYTSDSCGLLLDTSTLR